MKRIFLVLAVAALMAVMMAQTALPALAVPSNFPQNENACVGNSSTTANAAFQQQDPDKFRSDQAREDDGQAGRADSVAIIPQCQAAGLDRGVIR